MDNVETKIQISKNKKLSLFPVLYQLTCHQVKPVFAVAIRAPMGIVELEVHSNRGSFEVMVTLRMNFIISKSKFLRVRILF